MSDKGARLPLNEFSEEVDKNVPVDLATLRLVCEQRQRGLLCLHVDVG